MKNGKIPYVLLRSVMNLHEGGKDKSQGDGGCQHSSLYTLW